MTDANRVRLKSGIESKSSRVLRPVAGRWLKALRPAKDQHDDGMRSTGVVHVLPTELPDSNATTAAESANADNADRLVKLQQQVAQVEVAYCEWTERCSRLESCVDRAQQQRQQARDRLSLVGEPVPSSDTERLSTLQASHLNFTMALELQQQKLEQAMHKVARLQNRRASLYSEVLARSDDPRTDDQDFRHAA